MLFFLINTQLNGVTYTVETGKNYAIVGVPGINTCNAINKNTFTSRQIQLETTVTINSQEYDVLEIAPYAFYQYKSFQSIVFPQKLVKIGEKAFDQGNHNITEISFPNSVTYLGNYCFAVARIKIFKIGKNVNYIGNCIIGADPVLEKIIVDRNNPYFAHDAHFNLYSKNFTVLYQINAIRDYYVTLQTVRYLKTQSIDAIPIKSVTITQDCYFENYAIAYCHQLEIS